MFQFRRFPSYAYLIQRRMTEYCSAGFPHSVISGSKPMCGSPKLIAACHDLHRLLMPRHSPCALISLTFVGASSISLASGLCPKARSFRCSSSPKPEIFDFRLRFEGLWSGYLLLLILKNYVQITEKFHLAYCFLPVRVFHNFASFCLFCCLLFIFFVVQFSRCYLLISYLRPDRNV